MAMEEDNNMDINTTDFSNLKVIVEPRELAKIMQRVEEVFKVHPVFENLYENRIVGDREEQLLMQFLIKLAEEEFTVAGVFTVMESSKYTKWKEANIAYKQQQISQAFSDLEGSKKLKTIEINNLERIANVFAADKNAIIIKLGELKQKYNITDYTNLTAEQIADEIKDVVVLVKVPNVFVLEKNPHIKEDIEGIPKKFHNITIINEELTTCFVCYNIRETDYSKLKALMLRPVVYAKGWHKQPSFASIDFYHSYDLLLTAVTRILLKSKEGKYYFGGVEQALYLKDVLEESLWQKPEPHVKVFEILKRKPDLVAFCGLFKHYIPINMANSSVAERLRKYCGLGIGRIADKLDSVVTPFQPPTEKNMTIDVSIFFSYDKMYLDVGGLKRQQGFAQEDYIIYKNAKITPRLKIIPVMVQNVKAMRDTTDSKFSDTVCWIDEETLKDKQELEDIRILVAEGWITPDELAKNSIDINTILKACNLELYKTNIECLHKGFVTHLDVINFLPEKISDIEKIRTLGNQTELVYGIVMLSKYYKQTKKTTILEAEFESLCNPEYLRIRPFTSILETLLHEGYLELDDSAKQKNVKQYLIKKIKVLEEDKDEKTDNRSNWL